MARNPALRIQFVEQIHAVDSARPFRFGRAGDLTIDANNQHLHRELGEFVFLKDQWWLRNVGRSIPLRAWTSEKRSRFVVMSGSEVALTAASTTIEFEAGKTRYDLVALLDVRGREFTKAPDKGDPDNTISATDLPLTRSQLQLILSLAENSLNNPGAAVSVPPSKEAAARLGWTMTKFNSKLKNVCAKYAQLGIRGLGPDSDGATMDRRLRLVEYCIFNKVVTSADLLVLNDDERD